MGCLLGIKFRDLQDGKMGLFPPTRFLKILLQEYLLITKLQDQGSKVNRIAEACFSEQYEQRCRKQWAIMMFRK